MSAGSCGAPAVSLVMISQRGGLIHKPPPPPRPHSAQLGHAIPNRDDITAQPKRDSERSSARSRRTVKLSCLQTLTHLSPGIHSTSPPFPPPETSPAGVRRKLRGEGGEERAAALVFPHRQPSTSQSQRINPPLGGGVLRDWRPRLPPELLRHPPPPLPPPTPPSTNDPSLSL